MGIQYVCWLAGTIPHAECAGTGCVWWLEGAGCHPTCCEHGNWFHIPTNTSMWWEVVIVGFDELKNPLGHWWGTPFSVSSQGGRPAWKVQLHMLWIQTQWKKRKEKRESESSTSMPLLCLLVLQVLRYEQTAPATTQDALYPQTIDR